MSVRQDASLIKNSGGIGSGVIAINGDGNPFQSIKSNSPAIQVITIDGVTYIGNTPPLEVVLNGTTTNPVVLTSTTSVNIKVTGNTNGYVFILPRTSTVSIGSSWFLYNYASVSFIVQSYNTQTVLQVFGGTTAQFKCVSTSSENATSWVVYTGPAPT